MNPAFLNPIVMRELRARWRGRRAFGTVCGYSALLAIAVGWLCFDVLDPTDKAQQLSGGTASAGHSIFLWLTGMQIFGWMMLAPSLTASSIAAEREHGLLEGLQLSPLSAGQIVSGKLGSALLFALILWLCALPITAICFLLGGVSSTEYLMALLLQFSTAITGSVIGLFFSAWSRRAGVALRKTFVTLIVWGIAAVALSIVVEVARWSSGTLTPWYLPWARISSYSHPLMAYARFLSDGRGPAPPINSSSSWLGQFLDFASTHPLETSLILQALLCIWLFSSAVKALRRPLPEQYWFEPSHKKTRATRTGAASAGDKPQTASTMESAAPGLWWEIPLTSLLRFKNPLLQREVRGKFRMRRVSAVVIVFEAMLGAGVLYMYCQAAWWAMREDDARLTVWWVICFTALMVVMVACAVMGAGAFSREREGATFESLFLSLLSNREIMLGKALAPVIACFVFGLPLVPLLALCIRGIWFDASAPPGISLSQAIGTVLILAATAWCYTAWGMLLSWRCRRTPVAVGWTIGTLFLANVFAPILFSIADSSSLESLSPFHPVVALAAVASPEDISSLQGYPLVFAAFSALCLFAMGGFFLLILRNSMQNRARESDQGILSTQ